MGLGQSLRAVVDRFGAAPQDYDEFDEYDEYEDGVGLAAPERVSRASFENDDVYPGESGRHARKARQDETGALSVVSSPRSEFAVLAPQDFTDAQQIADRLRTGTPVIIDLEHGGRELSKRLIDFCSGLCYALEAELQYVGEHVVLLRPHDLELSSEALNGLSERQFFNQV
jgi:cell division inhibitor SepF